MFNLKISVFCVKNVTNVHQSEKNSELNVMSETAQPSTSSMSVNVEKHSSVVTKSKKEKAITKRKCEQIPAKETSTVSRSGCQIKKSKKWE